MCPGMLSRPVSLKIGSHAKGVNFRFPRTWFLFLIPFFSPWDFREGGPTVASCGEPSMARKGLKPVAGASGFIFMDSDAIPPVTRCPASRRIPWQALAHLVCSENQKGTGRWLWMTLARIPVENPPLASRRLHVSLPCRDRRRLARRRRCGASPAGRNTMDRASGSVRKRGRPALPFASRVLDGCPGSRTGSSRGQERESMNIAAAGIDTGRKTMTGFSLPDRPGHTRRCRRFTYPRECARTARGGSGGRPFLPAGLSPVAPAPAGSASSVIHLADMPAPMPRRERSGASVACVPNRRRPSP